MAARNNMRLQLMHCFQQTTLNTSILVHSFGSTINGFGFKNSDLDFYVSGIDFKTAYVSVYYY